MNNSKVKQSDLTRNAVDALNHLLTRIEELEKENKALEKILYRFRDKLHKRIEEDKLYKGAVRFPRSLTNKKYIHLS